VSQRTKDGVEDGIETLHHILREEPQHEPAIFLQELVLAPVPAIGLGVSQVLITVDLDRDCRAPRPRSPATER
jgi:hypothetical protein